MLLNLAEDHLDRHGTFEAYRAAKLAIFAHQPPGTLAVVRPRSRSSAAAASASRSARRPARPPGAPPATRGDAAPTSRTATARCLARRAADGGGRDPPARRAQPRERDGGRRGLPRAGRGPGAVREALATFAGVPHRLEEIGTVGGVTYINDSKATNVASAEVGIRSFAGGVHLIAGGSGKGSDYTPLARARQGALQGRVPDRRDRRRAARGVGATGVPLHDCGDLERAVAQAHATAAPGDVVLLSPGCASYDQYRSYEERGDHFREPRPSR